MDNECVAIKYSIPLEYSLCKISSNSPNNTNRVIGLGKGTFTKVGREGGRGASHALEHLSVTLTHNIEV